MEQFTYDVKVKVESNTSCLHNVEAWPCVSKVVAGRGIRRVAAVALKRDQTVSGTPELVITGRLVLADVELVVIGTRFCQQCTDDTLGELTTSSRRNCCSKRRSTVAGPSSDRLPARWFAIGGAVAVAAGAGLYAVDQDPGHTDSQERVTRYYYDAAPPGVALGAVGLASVGVGVWCWTRRAGISSLPTVSVGSSQTMVDGRGGFEA